MSAFCTCSRFSAWFHTRDLRALDHAVGDFLAAVGGEAVQEDGVPVGGVHQRLVHDVALEGAGALLLLLLLAHRGPHVGVHHVRAARGLARIGGERDAW